MNYIPLVDSAVDVVLRSGVIGLSTHNNIVMFISHSKCDFLVSGILYTVDPETEILFLITAQDSADDDHRAYRMMILFPSSVVEVNGTIL